MRLRVVAGLLMLIAVTRGCLSVKAYVDPQLPTVSYADLLTRRDPRPVALPVEFHRNGEPVGASTARKVVEGLVLNLLLDLQKEEQI